MEPNTKSLKICKFLSLFIQYADDKDVALFLKNCSIKTDKYFASYCTPKDVLLYTAAFMHYYYCTSVYTEKEIFISQIKKEHVECVLAHLEAMTDCFNSFINRLKQLSSVKNLDIIIENIIHVCINNYAKYGFYYYISDNCINKIKVITTNDITNFIDIENDFVEHVAQYKIKIIDRKVHLINADTNERFNLNVTPKQFNDFYIKNLHNFEELNLAIMKSLSYKHEYCYWCYPNSISKSKKKCDNCIDLHKALVELQKITKNEEIKKLDITKKLSEIQHSDMQQLRKERAKYILSILKSANISDNQLKERIKLLNKDSFK